MSEYIEREALMTLIRANLQQGSWYGCEEPMYPVVEETIMDIPAVDVVPVVRCRDCIHRYGAPGQPNILCAQMHDDDFCSYGERRNDD